MEPSIASFVSLYLKNAGYAVKAVTTGSDALAQVESEEPALVVLDLMLSRHRRHQRYAGEFASGGTSRSSC